MIGCVNARSVSNKAAMLSYVIADERLDAVVITETWHEGPDSSSLRRLTPPGYRFIDAARPIPPGASVNTVDFQNHGGLALVHRTAVKFQKRSLGIDITTFEYLFGFASTSKGHFVLLGVYRPGSQVLSSTFFSDLSQLFERLSTYNCPVVVCGDFNVHVDDRTDVHALHPQQLLESFGYVQHVTGPTHSAGHTLDLVIARSDTEISAVRVGGMISDHALINFNLRVKRPNRVVRWVTSRAWRRLQRDVFASDLATSRLCSDLTALENVSFDDLTLYGDSLTSLLDKHYPAVKVRRRTKQSVMRFDADCREDRRRTRRAERRFRSTCADADQQEWTKKMIDMRAVYENKNNQFWRTEIAASSGNTNQLWKTLHGVQPKDDTCTHNADDFAAFFTNKVDQVRAATASSPLYHVPVRSTPTLAE